MNRAWKILIAVGIISLALVVGWEFFQISTGGRSTFNLSVIEMGRSNLISEELENHLTTDTEYRNFNQDSTSN